MRKAAWPWMEGEDKENKKVSEKSMCAVAYLKQIVRSKDYKRF